MPWKEQVAKKQIRFSLHEMCARGKSIQTKVAQFSVVLGLGFEGSGRIRRVTPNGHRVAFGKCFKIRLWIVTQLCKYAKHIEQYTSDESILWDVNYVSTKLFLKAFMYKRAVAKKGPSSHRSGICIKFTALYAYPDA